MSSHVRCNVHGPNHLKVKQISQKRKQVYCTKCQTMSAKEKLKWKSQKKDTKDPEEETQNQDPNANERLHGWKRNVWLSQKPV